MKRVTLSGRLQAVASMVTAGNRVCDVGCDHGFVSIYLAEQSLSPAVLAMDVRNGPLGAAKEHIAERNLESVIATRLSDGLHNYKIGEADTLICAGMGGGLMERILSEDRAKTESFRELVLQPQSEVERFRAWLRRQGYRITEEKMVEEDGKFYPMMRAQAFADSGSPGGGEEGAPYGNLYGVDVAEWREHLKNNTCIEMSDTVLCKLENRYGALLMQRGDRTLASYLRREERIYDGILVGLSAQGLSDEKRKIRHAQITELVEECRMAYGIVRVGRKT